MFPDCTLMNSYLRQPTDGEMNQRNPDPKEPANWPLWPQAKSGGQKSIDHTCRPCHAPASRTGAPPKPPRKTVPSVVLRCPDWFHSVFLVLSQFPPFLHSWTPGGQDDESEGKSEGRKRQAHHGIFEGSTIHTAFSAAVRSRSLRRLAV
jgi:hypothetical protein